ncbi:MAG: helix-turn-helix domain-containing protein [Chloroflexi bacterium]|nr:helix-turn-helix domain-containing protein [Chloroflexota bacterium]
MDTFGTVLQRFRARAGVSQLALSKICGVHASIINRFERDERQPADRDMIDRLAAGLALAPVERDQLLAAGGFFPRAIERLGAADPDLLLVASVLTDERLSVADRDEFRTVLRLLAGRWRPGVAAPAPDQPSAR